MQTPNAYLSEVTMIMPVVLVFKNSNRFILGMSFLSLCQEKFFIVCLQLQAILYIVSIYIKSNWKVGFSAVSD